MTRIRIIDIETTGLRPSEGAEVIEFGWWDVVTDGHIHRVTDHDAGVRLYRPIRPCPPEVMAVHHILPEQLEHCEPFSISTVSVCMDITTGKMTDYYAAHNAEYEMLFLQGLTDEKFVEPAPGWICTYKAALRVWPEAPSHSNNALMYWLGLHTDMDEEARHPPHRALPDAYVTAHIMVALLHRATIQEMAAWTLEPRLLSTCPIGKFRGRPWPEVDHGFLEWMLRQPDMGADLKWNAERELTRRRRGD